MKSGLVCRALATVSLGSGLITPAATGQEGPTFAPQPVAIPVPVEAEHNRPARRTVDFNREIRPILADNCFECHGPDAHGRKGDLRLDLAQEALAEAIVPGQPEQSEFVKRLLTHDEDDRMPPPESPRQPTPKQIELLTRWIAEGADYDEHWAFVPPVRPDLPPVSDPGWIKSPVDAFVLAHHDSLGLSARPDAPAGVLARRLSLALTGLPALPGELERFEADFKASPDRTVDAWVDDLLASPAFGEHLAWVWMDAARYADTNGYQGDGPRVMWPWRDWLVGALNGNLPFDQMTEQMLAGDLLAKTDWESADWIPDRRDSELLMATGFLRNHRYDTGSGTIPEESKFENAADRSETVGTVWMGLTLQCARCHTHKFDPIEQREYYQLLSFFDKVPEVGSALKGASHPYIHTPTEKERDTLEGLRKAKTEAETAFEAATETLAESQSAWEHSLATAGEFPRVNRGLKFRFAEEGIAFDGTNAVTESNKPVMLCAGSKAWSISLWFRPESDTDGAIFSSVEEPERYRPGIQADWVGGKVRVRHVCRWVNSYIEFESAERLTPGQWHHVSFRCDGRMQGLAYAASLDGNDAAMICTHPVTNDSAENAGKAPLILGSSPLMPGFKGELKDLRFYDRTLPVEEIASLADLRTTPEIADVPAAKRSPSEIRTLRLAFLESDALPPPVAALQEKWFAAETALREAVAATPTTMVMREAVRGSTRLHPTGAYDSLGEPVTSGVPAILPPMPGENPDRLALARWLMQPGHPLTARVAVNRIWQLLWGRGFVDSPENFGTQCAEPIHSDLLDWLATEYVANGWDTKALIRLIVTSRAYRQDSGADGELWTTDPENRHLARGPRFRLPIHAVRDHALALSGRLDPALGGPPVLFDEVPGKDGKPTNLPYEVSNQRRTIYAFWKRNAAHPLLAVFDVADRNQCDVRVRRTNTPLQALVTLNEPGLAACARDFSKRARAAAPDEAGQLRWAWQACTGRVPSQREAGRLAWTLGKYRESSGGNEDQAWTALANVLLNLDATLSIE